MADEKKMQLNFPLRREWFSDIVRKHRIPIPIEQFILLFLFALELNIIIVAKSDL